MRKGSRADFVLGSGSKEVAGWDFYWSYEKFFSSDMFDEGIHRMRALPKHAANLPERRCEPRRGNVAEDRSQQETGKSFSIIAGNYPILVG